jgi:hypothetical protein
MTDHPIIRQLSEYDEFVHEVFQKEAWRRKGSRNLATTG